MFELCAVSESIQTSPTDNRRDWNFLGNGVGSARPKILKKCSKLDWNLQRDGRFLEKFSSLGEIKWKFSGTTHFIHSVDLIVRLSERRKVISLNHNGFRTFHFLVMFYCETIKQISSTNYLRWFILMVLTYVPITGLSWKIWSRLRKFCSSNLRTLFQLFYKTVHEMLDTGVVLHILELAVKGRLPK